MDSKNMINKVLTDPRLMSLAEWSILRPAIVRKARSARAAAITDALRSLAAGIFRPFATVSSARQRRRLEREAAAELEGLGDYALGDLGIARSEIRRLVQLPGKGRWRS